MRILTVRQPWAYAIIHLGKDVENRTRNVAGAYRGPVAIHAGLNYEGGAHVWDQVLGTAIDMAGFDTADIPQLPRGLIIGVVDLVDVHTIGECWERGLRKVHDLYRTDRAVFDALPDSGAGGLVGKVRVCSPWAELTDVHHLVFANPRPLPEPVPFRGGLGLRTLPSEVEAALFVRRRAVVAGGEQDA